MTLISIIVPVYNEQQNVRALYEQLQQVVKNSPDYQFEVIFVNDGSRDDTAQVLDELAAQDRRVHYIEFSRNFGKEIATTAGLHAARGDAVFMIDCDLQHPVNKIPEFIAKWKAGADVVIGVRTKNQGEGIAKRFGSFAFYKLMNLIGEVQIVPGSTDFRLLDKKVVSEFRRFNQHNRMTRALIDWLGFKKDYVFFEANAREYGDAGYTIQKLIILAINSFVTNSLVPLKLSGYLGCIVSLFFGSVGLYVLLGRYVFDDPYAKSFTGPAQLAILIIFLVGVIHVSLGIMALYIANIHNEIVDKPMYIVRRSTLDKKDTEL